MKRIHRIFSLLLVCMLTVSLAVPAWATGENPDQSVVQVPTTGNFSLTINNATNGDVYEIYMIFYGTHHQVENNDDDILTDIKWGSGVIKYGENSVTAGSDAGHIAAGLQQEGSAVAFSKALTLGTALKSATVVNGVCKFENLPAGYYLVKHAAPNAEEGIPEPDAFTSYIIRVVGDETASPKVNVPSLEKKTSDINDTTYIPGHYDNHVESADFDIGDLVPFHIHIDVGDNIENYDEYTMVVTDTMSAGLTFIERLDQIQASDGLGNIAEEDLITVTLENQALVKGTHYTITSTTKEGGVTEIKFSFPDLKNAGVTNTDTLTIDYYGRLNEKAVIGSAGNPNTAVLEYSNNPYDEEDMGQTPPDTVKIFTYQVDVNKVNASQQPLQGATFKLSKYIYGLEGYWKEVKTIDGTNLSEFVFKGLDDGTYKLEEVTPPAGYNSIKPFEFRIDATHTETEVTSLIATPLHGSGQTFTRTDGVLATTVVNQMGATLPTTGGMGTTLIYAVGGILVLAAVVLLVTKKRMSDAE